MKFNPDPDNPEQRRAALLFEQHPFLVLTGRAGTSKTHTAVRLAMTLDCPIYVTRPQVSSSRSEKHETLPGELDAKYAPWMGPVGDVMRDRTPHRIKATPFTYIRGRTLDGVWILDEAQNATREQIILGISRIGRDGKAILCGDVNQCDIPNSGLAEFIELQRGLIAHVEMKKNYRHPLIDQMLRRYDRA